MKRVYSFILATAMVLGAFASAQAATEVKMTGDVLIYGDFFNGRNFTGWNRAAKATEENLEIWQRVRVRSDFVASEAVKFRLGIKVIDTWGHGTYTAANPTAGYAAPTGAGGTTGIGSGVQIYLAYLQFKWPDTNLEITAGLQDVNLPHSALFNNSPVFADKAAGLTFNIPLIPDTLSVVTGFTRLLDTNQTFDVPFSSYNMLTNQNRSHQADELDAYLLAVPITLDGFKATPWGLLAIAGRDADYYDWKSTTNLTSTGTNFAANLVSAATMTNGPGSHHKSGSWHNAQNPYYWVGSAFEVSTLDPVRFYGDVIYGAGAQTDVKSAHRQGWFVDAGAEYTGLDVVTPQIFGWWSTGEDKSYGNGSERMPYVRSNWGPGNSLLFDNSQEFTVGNNMDVTPVGNWGLGASLNNISFIEKLTNRLTFVYLRGTNSARALRWANILTTASWGSEGSYVAMGHDLTTNEYLYGLSFDTKYMIYENLAAVVEAGWAHGQFQESVWNRTTYHRAANLGDNAWKVTFGLSYKF